MSVLEKIITVKQSEVQALKKQFSRQELEEQAAAGSVVQSLTASIRNADGMGIIAEVKKASPSRGVLREDFDPCAIAHLYAQNNVAGISVLTDKQFFQGDIQYLRRIAEQKTCPVLRKDFIIDDFQILEARANGADAVLLIAEALSKQQIVTLSKTAYGLGLEVLLELHSEEELKKIDTGLNTLIGVNNRNLSTFVTDIDTTIRLRDALPPSITVVSESGLGAPGTIERIKDAGCNAILVGEYFMREQDIGAAVRALKARCA
jgi:indole-3-glycerol phosphate synthase